MKKMKPVKAYAVINRNGTICPLFDARCVFTSMKHADGYCDTFNGERIVRVLITPIVKKK